MRAEKKPIIRLLNTARGQIDGLCKMIDEDRYCMDISNQLLATQAILKKANQMVLRAHLEGCVKDSISEEEGREKIEEIVVLLDKMSR